MTRTCHVAESAWPKRRGHCPAEEDESVSNHQSKSPRPAFNARKALNAFHYGFAFQLNAYLGSPLPLGGVLGVC